MSQNEQVIKPSKLLYCPECHRTREDEDLHPIHRNYSGETCNGIPVSWVPLSEHNRLKEKLKKALKIIEDMECGCNETRECGRCVWLTGYNNDINQNSRRKRE